MISHTQKAKIPGQAFATPPTWRPWRLMRETQDSDLRSPKPIFFSRPKAKNLFFLEVNLSVTPKTVKYKGFHLPKAEFQLAKTVFFQGFGVP